MQENTAEKIPSLVSDENSLKQESPEISRELPKSVALQLYGLMQTVTAKKINPGTVRAACLCASEIHKILKLNLEVKRLERGRKPVEEESEVESERLDTAKILKVKDALEKCNGNKTRAAEQLGVSIRSLRNWVQLYEGLSMFRHQGKE